MTDTWKRMQVFSGGTLKLIAIVTMLIDHIGAAILYYSVYTEAGISLYYATRRIGRIAFPIFCFLLVEGFLHTHDVKKYATRLGIFCLLSEVPFDLALTGNENSVWMHQNVFWTLLIALLVLVGLRLIENKIPVTASAWQGILTVLCIAAGCTLAYLMHTDYDYKGVLAICILYLLRAHRGRQVIAGALCFLWEPWALIGFIPILLYNGKRGMSVKYFFYLFYPVHLLLLYLIAHILLRLY
ncbi:MAG: TraX family protein [Hespellia sp.]|nr:TraX family protein [Hespellia sp.]